MPEHVTFIHAADLHLGAPFRGLRALSDAWAARLLSALAEAYDRVIDAAIARDADFVVMAGDVFDTARPSTATTGASSRACAAWRRPASPFTW